MLHHLAKLAKNRHSGAGLQAIKPPAWLRPDNSAVPSLGQQGLHDFHPYGDVSLNNIPDHTVFDHGIAMDQLIAKGHDLSQIRYAGRQSRIPPHMIVRALKARRRRLHVKWHPC